VPVSGTRAPLTGGVCLGQLFLFQQLTGSPRLHPHFTSSPLHFIAERRKPATEKSYEEHIQISNNTQWENVMSKTDLGSVRIRSSSERGCHPAHAKCPNNEAQDLLYRDLQAGKADYSTIQEAVTGVAPGSIVDVCPGSYPELVTIQQPITLPGVQSGSNASAVTTAPSNGLLSPTIPVAISFAAQLAVSSGGGPANISGLTVDGTGITASTSGPRVAGILYNSSPGTLNRVVVQNLAGANPNSTTVGVEIRDDNAVSPANSVQNSLVSFPTASGSFVGIEADTVIAVNCAEMVTSSAGIVTLEVTNITSLPIPTRQSQASQIST
jgi:hypothetical protein